MNRSWVLEKVALIKKHPALSLVDKPSGRAELRYYFSAKITKAMVDHNGRLRGYQIRIDKNTGQHFTTLRLGDRYQKLVNEVRALDQLDTHLNMRVVSDKTTGGAHHG